MIRYVGIDLHKRLLVAHILDEQGNTVATPRCEPVTAASLERFAKRHLKPGDQLALEVTTHVWAVVRFLEPLVDRIVVSNPMATKAIASAKVKTDKVDAEALANLLRLDYLPSVWMPGPEQSLRRWPDRPPHAAGPGSYQADLPDPHHAGHAADRLPLRADQPARLAVA